MLIEKIKNLPKEQPLKDAREKDPSWSSLVDSFLAGLTADALQALGTCENTAAADLLQIIDAGEFPKELKKTARKALYRLSTRGIKPFGPAEQKKTGTLPPPVFKEAYASEVDAEGNQLLLGVFEDSLGGLILLYFLAGEALGFRNVNVSRASRKHLQEYIRHFEDHHIHLTALPLEEFRWLVYRYQLVAQAPGKSLPATFSPAQKLLGETEGLSSVCPLYAELSWPSPEKEAEALAQVEGLLNKGEGSWWLPQDKVASWQKKYQEAEKGVLVIEERVKKEQLAEIEDQALQDLLTEEFSGKIKNRLEVWAALLWAQGKEAKAKGVLAAAHALELDPSGQRNPLIRALISSALRGEQGTSCEHGLPEPEDKKKIEADILWKPQPGPESSLLWTPGKKVR